MASNSTTQHRILDLPLCQHFLGVFLMSTNSLCKDANTRPHTTRAIGRYPEHAQTSAGSSTPLDYESALSLYGHAYLWEKSRSPTQLVEEAQEGEYTYWIEAKMVEEGEANSG